MVFRNSYSREFHRGTCKVINQSSISNIQSQSIVDGSCSNQRNMAGHTRLEPKMRQKRHYKKEREKVSYSLYSKLMEILRSSKQ